MSQKRKQEEDKAQETCIQMLHKRMEHVLCVEKCFAAAEAGDLEKLHTLIREDSRNTHILLNEKDRSGNSVLMKVVLQCKDLDSYRKREAMIMFLLDEVPPLVTQKNNKEEIPVLVACRKVLHPELIDLLLQRNPDSINIRDKHDRNLLHLVALAAGDTQKFERETPIPLKGTHFYSDVDTDSEPDLDDTPQDKPPTPYNTIFNCVSIAEVLIKHGIDIHTEDKDKQTVLQLLYENNATYLPCPHFQAYKDQYEQNVLKFLELMLQNGAHLCSSLGKSALKNVCSVEEARLMIAHCPQELNTLDCYGRTPLHQLIKRVTSIKPEIILFLLDNGAVLEDGTDPIMLIRANRCRFEALEYFLNKTPDYDINSTDEDGCTIFEQYGIKFKIVEKLLSLGAIFPLTSTDYHENALQNAYKNNDPKLVMFLLQNGVDPYLTTEARHFIYIELLAETSFLECIVKHFVNESTENVEEWKTVLNYYLGLPKMTDTTMPEELKSLYKKVLSYLVKQRNSVIHDKVLYVLQQLLFYNKGINEITCKNIFTLHVANYEYESHECEVQFCSIVFYIVWLKSFQVQDEFCSVIQKMLSNGMCILNTPPHCVSILTVALSLMSVDKGQGSSKIHTKTEELQRYFAKLFIENGVDITSSGLQLVEQYSKNVFEIYEDFKSSYQLPDALGVSFLNNDSYHVHKLISYWWAPPLLLLQLSDTTTEFEDWFPILIQYGGAPNGNSLFNALSLEINATFRNSEAKEPQDTKKLAPQDTKKLAPQDTWNAWKLMTESPTSLEETCKYKVRELVYKRACQPNTSLPQILHELLPPLLRRAVNH